MVIGWDSSDFALIRPWMNEGYLPNLNNLIKVSKHGNLKSVYPPVTPMAWSNIVTGKNAGKHGLNGFMTFRSNSYDVEPVSASNRVGKDVWELLSDFGKKVAVVGVPLTFPVREVNGCIISGFLTPSGAKNYCFPKNLKDEITAKVPGYTPSRPTNLAGEYNTVSDKEYVDSLFTILERHIEGMLYIAEKKDWDFFMGVFNETDWVQHKFWATIDKDHPRYDKTRAEKFGTVIRDVHSRLDEALGDLIRIAQGANILVISDHGAAPLYWNVNTNYYLFKIHRLQFKRNIPSTTRVIAAKLGFSREYVFRLIKRLYGEASIAQKKTSIESMSGKGSSIKKEPRLVKLARAIYSAFLLNTSDVDWSKTVAYAPPGGNGAIFLNVKGRFPNGIIEDSQYPHVREDLIQAMKGLGFRDERIVDTIFTREELFNGQYSSLQPDIQLHFANGYQGMGGFTFDLRHIFVEPQSLYGIHSMNGILVLRERDFESSSRTVNNAQLVDIVPTILHIMEVPIPADLDGKSLADKKENPVMDENKLGSQRQNASSGYTKEEEEDIEQRLRSLGYL